LLTKSLNQKATIGNSFACSTPTHKQCTRTVGTHASIRSLVKITPRNKRQSVFALRAHLWFIFNLYLLENLFRERYCRVPRLSDNRLRVRGMQRYASSKATYFQNNETKIKSKSRGSKLMGISRTNLLNTFRFVIMWIAIIDISTLLALSVSIWYLA